MCLQSLTSFSGLNVHSCSVGYRCGLDSIPDLGTSICPGCGHKLKKNKKEASTILDLFFFPLLREQSFLQALLLIDIMWVSGPLSDLYLLFNLNLVILVQ